ncbi:hypothetical protein CRUP_008390 [Coryphaenoides rupestris]|nr:hypothetical protein CRUP_008390 [Coryphaenoides rupestris]
MRASVTTLYELKLQGLSVTMVMKSSVDDDDAGWGLGIPEKMRNNVNWVDVTHEFKGACKELNLGELLHDKLFGLFEAMSAIEMMDPKMDAGMIGNQVNRKVLNFEQAVKDNAIKVRDLSLPELIGIIDTCFCCLITWLEGHSLAQTVFTCLYVHSPDLIEDPALKAFALGILKVCDIAREKVNKAAVFEEEDFQAMTYGFKMANNVTDLRVTGMLKDVEEELQRKVKSTRSRQGEQRNPEVELEHQQFLALFNRIKFIRLLLTALIAFTKKETNSVGEAQKLMAQAADLLSAIHSSIQYGIQSQNDTTKGDHPIMMGFEPLVNQRLLPPTFPRYAKIIKREDMVVYFSKLIERIKTVCDTTFLIDNKKVFGTHLMQDMIKDALRCFLSPPVLSSKCCLFNNPQAKEYIDSFVTHCSRLEPQRQHLACLGTWILTCSAAFELELYSMHEYYYIYWYLSEFLYAWLMSTLSRAESSQMAEERIAEEQQKGRSSKKAKKKKKVRPLSKEIAMSQAYQNMCAGMYKVRYEHRFAPFNSVVTPPPVHYIQFKEMSDLKKYNPPPGSSDLYLAASKHFQQAKLILENVSTPDPEVNRILKVAKPNMVVMKLLAGGHKRENKVLPEFDFTAHKYFPLVKII